MPFLSSASSLRCTRSRLRVRALCGVLSVMLVFAALSGAGAQHVYKANDHVPLFSNKVGPYDNPDETYPYHDQKVFCQPKQSEVKSQHLGEHLEGDVKARSVFSFPFAVDFERKLACSLDLDSGALAELKRMIARNFYYELVLDDVPVHGFVGKHVAALESYGLRGSSDKFYYFNHIRFTILFNAAAAKEQQQQRQGRGKGKGTGTGTGTGSSTGGGVIIYANVSRDEHDFELLDAEAPQRLPFYYSAKWVAVDTPYAQRAAVYHDHFFAARAHGSELEVHWLAILNSTVLVLLLTGFVAVILLRILRSDLARYAQDDAGEAADKEDYGWKVIARDVFRVPAPLLLFTALLGTGVQFIAMVAFTLALALVGLYYPGNDGALYVSSIVLYALTSAVGGFTSNFYYKKFEGANWTWNTVLTATVFALPFFAMALFVNCVAMYYEVTKALPLTTVLTVLTLWALVGLPLTLVGSVAGKNYAAPFAPPVRTKHFARQIPDMPWYRNRYTQIALAGFLPFSSIYIELHYIFASVWGRGMYQLWGILILVFVILFIVTAMTTVALTYFQLSLEDYRWWWISFIWGGSTGFYILGYSVYFWLYRSKMNGFLQASFYFGYQVFICYFFFLMLGSVGFMASFTFVKRIYKNLHMD